MAQAANKIHSKLVFVDRAPPGWFILDVMRKGGGPPFRPGRPRNDWCALLIDIEPDIFRSGARIKPSSLYLDLGRHKSLDAAWEHAEAMVATKH